MSFYLPPHFSPCHWCPDFGVAFNGDFKTPWSSLASTFYNMFPLNCLKSIDPARVRSCKPHSGQKIIFHITDVPEDYLRANGGQAGSAGLEWFCQLFA